MKKNFLLIISLLMMAALLVGCNEVSQEQSSDKLNVVVSILPQKAFVKEVGGDLVNVKELIPVGGSPATYDPKPSDLALVEKADIFFRVGHIAFEKSHMDKLIELNTDMDVVDTSVNVELREFAAHEEHDHHDEDDHEDEHSEDKDHNEEEMHDEEDDHDHEGIDPHVWLSPVQVKAQVDTIAETLAKHDPKNADIYKQNAKDFKAKLDTLNKEIETELNSLNTDKLMVFHPAWGYFADEYGLEQIAIEQSGKEPTAQELQHIIDEAKEENIKVIFVQSQFNKNIANSIAQEIGAVVVSIDPLSEDYINNLKSIAVTIKTNLD